MPYDTDPDWPQALQDTLIDYRKAWRAKMDEVNDCIAKSSEGEELVDQPEIDRKRVRVSGPFTVEAVQPPEESLDTESPIGGEPDAPLDTYRAETDGHDAINAEAYLDQMIRLLRNDGVRFPNNQTLKFATLDPIEGDILHAEGSWEDDDTERLVAVVFGPQHGPVTTLQVEECLPIASRRGYDELVFAGFSFDGAAQAIIQEDPNPRVRIHIAYINPDEERNVTKCSFTPKLRTLIHGYNRRSEMNILEMTEGELYKAGLEELIGQIGITYTEQFLKQCKPNDSDYTAERHKWLDDDPDIPTMVNQIQERKIEQAAEERIKAERIDAWRKGLLELTDIEICELGAKILTDKLGIPGSIAFLRHHFKQNEWAQSADLLPQPVSDGDTDAILTQQKHATEPQD